MTQEQVKKKIEEEPDIKTETDPIKEELEWEIAPNFATCMAV